MNKIKDEYFIKNFKCYRQKETWSCAAAAIRSIMNYYGYKVSEKELIYDGGIDENGASYEQIKNIVNQYNFTLRSKARGSVDLLKKVLKRGYPVLVNYQIDTINGKNGHYAIVVGIDSRLIHVADTSNYYIWDKYSKFTPVIRMKFATFLKRWWDADAELPRGRVIGWYGVIKPKDNKK